MTRIVSPTRPSATKALLLGSLSTLVRFAAATVSFDDSIPTALEIGGTYKVQWTTDAAPVKITLVSGTQAANNIYHLIDLVCNIWVVNNLSQACTSSDGELEWTPGDDVPEGVYSLMATANDGSEDISSQFKIGAAGSAPSSTSSTSSVASSTGSETGTQTTPTQSTSETSSTTPTDSNGAQNSDDSGASSSGLSTGAIAGIGVGAGVGGLAILGSLGFLVFRMGKKAAANKDKSKDDGSGGEDGTTKAESPAIPQGPELAGDTKQPLETKDSGIAEMYAPNIVHEAPDYKLRLETPGEKSFFNELDATGGSFVLPGSGRPSTERETATGADDASDKASGSHVAAPKIIISDEDDKPEPAVATTSTSTTTAAATAATEAVDEPVESGKTEEPVKSEGDDERPTTAGSTVEKSPPATESEEAAAGPSSAEDAPVKEAKEEVEKKEEEKREEEKEEEEKKEEEKKEEAKEEDKKEVEEKK